jgi:hypothetical protein
MINYTGTFFLDIVQVNYGYVFICKEAILGNCSKHDCIFMH